MGYDVHITRKAQWHTARGPKISADEWRAFVAAEPDLRWYPDVEDRDDRGVEIVDSLGNVVGVIYWDRGDVRTKNPNGELLGRMIEIADTLNARLMGDEGETYRDAASPHASRPPYFNAKNLTNEWEEPPEGFDAAHFTEQAARQKVEREAAAARNTEGRAKEVERLKALAAASNSPAANAARDLAIVAIVFAVFFCIALWEVFASEAGSAAAGAARLCAVVSITLIGLSSGVRRSKKWAVWSSMAFAALLLFALPVGPIAGIYLLMRLAKVKIDQQNK